MRGGGSDMLKPEMVEAVKLRIGQELTVFEAA